MPRLENLRINHLTHNSLYLFAVTKLSSDLSLEVCYVWLIALCLRNSFGNMQSTVKMSTCCHEVSSQIITRGNRLALGSGFREAGLLAAAVTCSWCSASVLYWVK